MKNIKVTYDGSYPCSCMGRLIISVDNVEIYNKKYCCESTGKITFDENWNENIECGHLIWEDYRKFNTDIQDAVQNVLDQVVVCCGGCI